MTNPSDYRYRIVRIEFKNSRTLELPDLVLVVGPNNAGKTQLLKDILALCASRRGESLVLNKAEPVLPESAQVFAETYPYRRSGDDLNPTISYLNNALQGEQSINIFANFEETFDEWIRGNPEEKLRIYAEYLGGRVIGFLRTDHRLALAKKQNAQKEDHQVANLMQALYRAKLNGELPFREEFAKAFRGQNVRLDYSLPGTLRLKVDRSFEDVPDDPREALEAMERKRNVDDQGDGFRAFSGLLLALMFSDRPLLLVDEPEAFLHPPQARQIGRVMANATTAGQKQVIVATHSTDVVRGAVAETRNALIVRIDRQDDETHVHVIDAQSLSELISDPLLGSSRVLDGLLHDGCVVVEGDSDARFLGAALQRVSSSEDIHVVAADNKQTIGRIIEVYRKYGVRSFGICDFDIWRQRSELLAIAKSCGAGQKLLQRLASLQDTLSSAVGESSTDARLNKLRNTLSKALADLPDSIESIERDTVEGKIDASLRNVESVRHQVGKWSALKRDGLAALSGAEKTECSALLDDTRGACSSSRG
jgi:energy-coupling factor transporter ATP-binding protein EcfA2